MAVVIDLIREFSPWIYGACAVAALWYLRVVLSARRERRYAVFSLEREQALNRVYGAWGAAITIALVMGAVYLLSTVVFRAVEPQLTAGQSTPTPVIVAPVGGTPTATPTLPEPDATSTPTPTKRPRPTARPSPTPGAAAPTEPPVQRPRCADPRSVITSPGLNAGVSGVVPIVGTAVHENFNYYKLEYGPGANPSDSEWSFFAEGNRPVRNGQLGVLNASLLPPGIYSIRLTVVDSSGNFPAPCQTTIVFR
jgi:hypothetical protein